MVNALLFVNMFNFIYLFIYLQLRCNTQRKKSMNEKSQVVLKSKGPASLQKCSFPLYHILQFRIQKN